jgi:DNA-binding beta-propeller fold protein YncE
MTNTITTDLRFIVGPMWGMINRHHPNLELTIDEKETVIAATGFADRSSIVFMTKSGKLIEYKDGLMKLMSTDDGVFHKGVAITSWGNRVYILDPASNQIWRYSYKGLNEKFGPAEGYLTETTDLSKAQGITIDSNVYVLSSNGDISKYYAGKKAKFYINNAPFNSLKDPKVIYTNEKLNEIYVMDAKEGRVLVYLKETTTGNLNYQTQYLFSNVGELRDMYVDADAKKMYILTANKVLESDLK